MSGQPGRLLKDEKQLGLDGLRRGTACRPAVVRLLFRLTGKEAADMGQGREPRRMSGLGAAGQESTVTGTGSGVEQCWLEDLGSPENQRKIMALACWVGYGRLETGKADMPYNDRLGEERNRASWSMTHPGSRARWFIGHAAGAGVGSLPYDGK